MEVCTSFYSRNINQKIKTIMIPKIIHYIWFGKKAMPDKIEKCINSWKKYLPEYKLMLWNEENFPIDEACQFVKEAYKSGQYAFVSDYVRFYVLHKYGGIYLDTDVEFIKPLDDKILDNTAVLVLDNAGYISGSTIMAEAKNEFISDCIAHYHTMPFIKNDGTYNNEVINTHMQNRLKPFGYRISNCNQAVSYKNNMICIYADEYFHVRSLLDGHLNLTQNSYCIHWHTILWASTKTKLINFFRINILVKILGANRYSRLTSKIKNGKSTL